MMKDSSDLTKKEPGAGGIIAVRLRMTRQTWKTPRERYEDEEITEDEYFAELERIADTLLAGVVK